MRFHVRVTALTENEKYKVGMMQDWLEPLIKIAVVVGALQGAVAYLVLVERKAAAYLQDRLGPNRVGPWGLLQPLADGLKFILKEELVPAGAMKGCSSRLRC